MATVVNQHFVCGKAAAQVMFEFIIGDHMPNDAIGADSEAAARYALNSQDDDIIVDLRKLNARPKDPLFDKFWAKMATVVEGRVDDRRHGELMCLMMCQLHTLSHTNILCDVLCCPCREQVVLASRNLNPQLYRADSHSAGG
jgi:hypothetical protein